MLLRVPAASHDQLHDCQAADVARIAVTKVVTL
jgi:hypothetical protein